MSTQVHTVEPMRRPPRAVDAVAERVRQGVLTGEFAAGTLLPSERDLAASLGISRLTLRAALARLEGEGLVRARQGEGVRVLDMNVEATLLVLPHLTLDRHPELFRSFLELRRAIACDAVALACERATAADLDDLARIAEAQATPIDDAAFIDGDLAFSRRLLAATDNYAMVLLFNTLAGVYRAHPLLTRAIVSQRALSLTGYTLVLGLLRARDAGAVREPLRQALELTDALTLEALRAASEPPARTRSGRRSHSPKRASP